MAEHKSTTQKPETEEWRAVPLMPDYEASSLGRLRRATRGHSYAPGHIFHPYTNNRGYKGVVITINGVKRHYLVHRLVALAFLPAPEPNQTVVNHIDGCRSNNRVQNLEWCSPRENSHHGWTVLQSFARGEKRPFAKLTAENVKQIREMKARGERRAKIAAQFGVAISTIDKIVKRLKWKHVS